MLEFDAYQRSETVRRILRAVIPAPGSWALDVGGYPGRLRALMPEYRWVICDPLVDAPGDQVVGDASALPFLDASVDVSVSLDVLEHIPPANRQAFLSEINRVSKKGFILSFPYDELWVRQAETTVRLAYEEKYAGKKHPWLEEHDLYGLPNADEIQSRCVKAGLHVQTLAVGKIERWQMLQLFGLMMEDHAEGIAAAKAVDEFYQSRVYPYDFYAPSYRIIFVCLKEDQPVSLRSLLPETQNDTLHDTLYVDLELQAFLLQQCAKQMLSGNHEAMPDAGIQDNFSHTMQDYIARLETGLRLWEDTCAMLNQRIVEEQQWRDQVESHPAVRMCKRIKQLLRR